ncbi:MAG: DUF4190 domain-containing protein [Anaerolineaceae bacterium]
MNNQPNYPYQQPLPTSTSGWAIFSLIAGLLAWLGVFGLGGLAAVIAGHVAKGQIRASDGRVGGDGLATAGLVLGYLNLALALLGICLFVLMFAGIIGTPLLCAPYLNSVNTY